MSHSLLGVTFVRRLAGITEVHCIVSQGLKCGAQRRPERFDRQQRIEQYLKIMRSWYVQPSFLHSGLQILFRTLLCMEADRTPNRPFAPARKI